MVFFQRDVRIREIEKKGVIFQARFREILSIDMLTEKYTWAENLL